MVENKGLIFKAVPEGWPVIGEHLAVETREFDPSAKPPPGGITTENIYAALDPYQRGRMRHAEADSYIDAFTLGQPLDNFGIARVLRSDTDKFAEGDLVVGLLPIEQFSRVAAEMLTGPIGFAKLHNPHGLDPTVFLNSLGSPGQTAYSSLYAIGKPKKGETIFVSSAAGAVGVLVGQLAKREGLRVVGSVGSDEKLRFIRDCGFDDGFNYKTEQPAAALKRLCPEGLDIYYDNVGGEQLEAALDAMNDWGRIVACGMISQYSAKKDERYGVPNLGNIVSKRLTMRGFIVLDSDMGPLYAKEHEERVGAWLADGSIKQRVDITEGIEHAAEALLGMWRGENRGRAVLKIGEL